MTVSVSGLERIASGQDEEKTFEDLTQHEIVALRTQHNLADAHTHQKQSRSQRDIVESLPTLWFEAEQKSQHHFEQKFIEAFFELHGQKDVPAMNRTLLAYAASVSMVIVGMYLKRRNLTVSLIEPCFDNLADLLKELQVGLSPLPEDVLANPSTIYEKLVATVQTDAVCIVDPNNPSGFTMLANGEESFAELIRYCVDYQKTLIMDFCFASFALCDPKIGRIPIYGLLESSGVSYIAIEDSGKTWPVQDAKCALVTTSRDLFDDVYNTQTTVILNVSPFTLNVLERYVRDSISDGFASVRETITTNRQAAIEALSGTILEHVPPVVETSVAWFAIQDPDLNATRLQQMLVEHDVYVLPGTYFFWNSPELGDRHVRVALAREPEMFREAVAALADALNKIARDR
ncbi:aminotransferase class I/II-fold pyridoxal phosphate-dependent enzyme [Mycolicibacterium sp. 624]|uniref:aminotransferase class I/II-fold pyridoxal phosphate-dependent enzyme n=1 Tax=Mycolicibacterium sp. 624 TaxID=3156314 RepID=UPI003396F4EA